MTRFHPERVDDPLVRRVVPALEQATARDPAAARFVTRTEVGFGLPWMPMLARDPMARLVLSESMSAAGLASAKRAVGRFAAAGVPIVVGTDAGNWDLLPYQFHATSTPREIELLGAAGLSPAEALAAATRTPARMLGLDHEIGTVEVGKRADLVVVAGDPLRNLRALRKIRWTVQDGVAKTPREWLRP